MDLAKYFAQIRPPFLEKEILGFWAALLEIVTAVADIHHYKRSHDGQKWRGYDPSPAPELVLLRSYNLDGTPISSQTTSCWLERSSNWLT
jgi:hypothetical protein